MDDDTSISVVPLGGRHVNHFWRLLHNLDIPFVTLLDLDLARHQGGWGRVRYALQQFLKFPTMQSPVTAQHVEQLPKWNTDSTLLSSDQSRTWISFLESAGIYFSSPLDLDFAMMWQFRIAYGVAQEELQIPDAKTVSAVLGKSHGDIGQYTPDQQSFFDGYHRRFKLGSKPAAHLEAMARLDDATINAHMPSEIMRLLTNVRGKLANLPE
jgi:putative ATP-dependent endonuclease of OLD family